MQRAKNGGGEGGIPLRPSVCEAVPFGGSAAVQRRFRFLDLCIRFGKMISKVCWCFNSAAELNATNSEF
jgi:hypothetical protein